MDSHIKCIILLVRLVSSKSYMIKGYMIKKQIQSAGDTKACMHVYIPV